MDRCGAQKTPELYSCNLSDTDAYSDRHHQPYSCRCRLCVGDPARGSDLLCSRPASAGRYCCCICRGERGFSANFIPSAIDPMLASITLEAARIFDPEIVLNPINNWYFTSASSVLIVLVGWYITDRIVEPRLKGLDIDGDEDQIPQMVPITDRESRAFWYGFIAMVLGLVGLFLWALPEGSGLRDPNWDNPEVSSLFSPNASLMQAIVPLIFVLMLIPGVVYGFASGKYSSSRDMIQNMTKSMESMGYYIVMAFFCALFIDAFNQSNVGLLIAVKGANFLEALSLPGQVTIVGIIILSAFVNLFIGSASAKWLLVSPI